MESKPKNNFALKLSKAIMVIILAFTALLSLFAHSYIAVVLSIVGIICSVDQFYLKVRPQAQAGSGMGSAFLLFIISTLFMIRGFFVLDKEKKEETDKARYAAYSDEQKQQIQYEKGLKEKEAEKQEKIQHQFNHYDGSHRGLVNYIKAKMKDPDSFKHVKTTYSVLKDDHLILTMEYRGKNSFGAIVTQSVTAESDLDGNITQVLQQ